MFGDRIGIDRGSLAGAAAGLGPEPCDQELPAIDSRRNQLRASGLICSWDCFPEGGSVDARVAGNPAQRDRLCRVYRHREVSQGARRKLAGSLRPEREVSWPRSVCLARLACGPDQLVSLDQHMAAIRLLPKRNADDDEGNAKQQSNHHHAPVGRSIRIMK